MIKRIFTILILITMVAAIPAMAAGAPVITTQPKPCSVVKGGSCEFNAAAKNDTGITWRLQSPDGSQDFPFTNAPEYFSGLKISGKNSDRLTLRDIPGEMDGWIVYCRYSNKAGRADTDKVVLIVTDRRGNRINESIASATPSPTPAHQVDAEWKGFQFSADEMVLNAIGCSIQFVDESGNAKGDSFAQLNFGEEYWNTLTKRNVTDGSVDVRITAEVPKGQRVEYWVINGVKYTFNTEVKSFTLRELAYGMTVEAVLSGQASKTLKTLQEIHQQRTEDLLLVEVKSARMAHVDALQKPAGGTFTEFDFTDDYINKATGKLEEGGRVTVRVNASIPEGQVVTYWRFNGARLNFNSDVTSFVVENLDASMLYQPVFHTKTTPVPMYTIKCEGCTFSGGGYSGAKSGTVPHGTRITITPSGNSSIGYWTGTYNAGEYRNGVSDKPITWTVIRNCSFTWHPEIN